MEDVLMEKRSLMVRVKDALSILRSDRPAFESYRDTALSETFRFTGWGWNKNWGTPIDYAREVGPLDGSSLVMAVVNWTATQLPEAPPVIQVPNADGALEPDWGNPAADLIRRPNPFYIWADYCHAVSLSWWIDGNCYFKKVRSVTGQVQELWYLPHFLVEERWPDDGRTPEVPTTGPNKALNQFISHYMYKVPGQEPVLYRQDDIIHIKRGMNQGNPRRGVGAFESCIKEIYGDNAVALFSATLMKNMGMTPYILSPKERDPLGIQETEARALKEQWIQKTTGAHIGEPVVNAIPLDVQKLGLNPQELDLSMLRRIPESRVAAVTGIPAALLQFLVGLENGTSFAAYREARQQGYESVIVPIQAVLGQQLTWQLVVPDMKLPRGAQLIFDLEAVRVLQEDRDAEYRRLTEALRTGAISRNQFNMSLGKQPMDKEEIFYVPVGLQPMTQERIEEVAAEVLEPEEQPAEDLRLVAGFADVDRYLRRLEESMKEFSGPSN